MAQHQRKPAQARTDDSTSTFKWILIAVAVLGVLGIGYAIWDAKAGGGAALGPGTLDDLDTDSVVQRAQPVRKGNPDAPVQIVEFADYQCPGCAHFASNVGLPIRTAYVDNGRIGMAYYDYPILSVHPHAFLAARAARCAGDQNMYWEMHDILYARQQEWSLDRSPPIERYTGYAQTIGADPAAFEACLRSDRHADVVTANALLGERLGVRSTPTVFLNGRNVGSAWNDVRAMRELIDAALAAAPGTGAEPAPADTPAAAESR